MAVFLFSSTQPLEFFLYSGKRAHTHVLKERAGREEGHGSREEISDRGRKNRSGAKKDGKRYSFAVLHEWDRGDRKLQDQTEGNNLSRKVF